MDSVAPDEETGSEDGHNVSAHKQNNFCLQPHACQVLVVKPEAIKPKPYRKSNGAKPEYLSALGQRTRQRIWRRSRTVINTVSLTDREILIFWI